jgi:hypothetical protein
MEIYKFLGVNALRIRIYDREGRRPTEFKVDPGGTAGETDRVFLFDLKRQKQ